MKICVLLPDSLLGRALVELLRSQGHQAAALEQCDGDCRLRISSRSAAEPEEEEPDSHALLVLQRGRGPVADDHPRAALEAALAEGGTAVWRAPLDTRLLLEVVREADASSDTPSAPPGDHVEDEPSGSAPDLSGSPHAWLVLDGDTGRVKASNSAARELLGISAAAPRPALADLPLPEQLREGIEGQSQGLSTDEIQGRAHLSTWWTNEAGQRVVCFLESVPLRSPVARHQQSLAALGTMAATLAHEIRNPVASLAGALDLLESENDPEDRAEVLTMARERVRQLARLLDKTLTLSRPITGPTEEVELRPAVESALNNLSMHPALEKVQVEWDMPEEPVPVQAFEGPLVQALTNILLNAAQAQDGKGTVRVSLETSGRRAILRIHDDGPGVPAEKRGKIFKPFYTTRHTGTGLGLAEVRRAVNAMGGTVTLEKPTKGACFRLELPLTDLS